VAVCGTSAHEMTPGSAIFISPQTSGLGNSHIDFDRDREPAGFTSASSQTPARSRFQILLELASPTFIRKRDIRLHGATASTSPYEKPRRYCVAAIALSNCERNRHRNGRGSLRFAKCRRKQIGSSAYAKATARHVPWLRLRHHWHAES
jgi:hypothetical protein